MQLLVSTALVSALADPRASRSEKKNLTPMNSAAKPKTKRKNNEDGHYEGRTRDLGVTSESNALQA